MLSIALITHLDSKNKDMKYINFANNTILIGTPLNLSRGF
jgi:hypothetical protein